MKAKSLNLLLVLTSLLGYLEWGGNNSIFLFLAEIEIVSKLFSGNSSAVHPFTILPLLGQILLIGTLFQKEPSRILTFLGMVCIGILLLFMFVIGLLSFKLKILFSTIPFLLVAIYVIVLHRKS